MSIKNSSIPSIEEDRFVVVRRSWITICNGNDCAAAMLNFFVSWHDWKIENQPRARRENEVAELHGVSPSQSTGLLQHHTIAEIKEGLCQMYGDKTIQKAIELLIKLNFVVRSSNPDRRYKFDRTNHYAVVPESIKLALSRYRKNAESISQLHPIESAITPSPQSVSDEWTTQLHRVHNPKTPDDLQDIIQDTYQDIFPTHTLDPEHAREKIFGAQILKPDPDPIQPPSKSNHNLIPSSNSNSGEEENSGACRTIETTAITPTGYLTETEKRYSPTLTRLELTELTQTLIDTYNKSKPSSWGICTKLTSYLVKQTQALIKIYSERSEINEAIESLVNDFGAAHLGVRGDKFYDSPTFGISSIAFFLDAKRVDSLQARAQVWYDRPQQAKIHTAKAIANEIKNGVPCHETGEILSTSRYLSRARRFAKNISLPTDHELWSTMPDMDHLHKYYPQIFEAK
jgi:hypothetical protein